MDFLGLIYKTYNQWFEINVNATTGYLDKKKRRGVLLQVKKRKIYLSELSPLTCNFFVI